MNLSAIAAGLTRAVTPPVVCTLHISTGRTVTADDGTRTPEYDVRTRVTADVQAASSGDLRQLEGMNISGVERVAYLRGNVEGVNRVRKKGGDLVVFEARSGVPAALVGTWLVTAVLETWDTGDWCKVGLTLQTEAPA